MSVVRRRSVRCSHRFSFSQGENRTLSWHYSERYHSAERDLDPAGQGEVPNTWPGTVQHAVYFAPCSFLGSSIDQS